MRVRFLTGVATASYAYDAGQEVAVTDRYGPDEIPRGQALAWAAGGTVETVDAVELAVVDARGERVPSRRRR